MNASLAPAYRESVLPARAIVAIRCESRRVLAFHATGASATVSVALPIRERKTREVDVGWRRLDVRWDGCGRSRALSRRDTRFDRGRRAPGQEHGQRGEENERTRVRDGKEGRKQSRQSVRDERGKILASHRPRHVLSRICPPAPAQRILDRRRHCTHRRGDSTGEETTC